MEKVVYADVLFLVNFGCDLITVCLTARFCRLILKPLRAAAAAAFGAFASVLITLFLDGILSYFAGVPVAGLICLFAFGKTRFIELLRRTAIMWSSACLFYGAVSAFGSAVNKYFNNSGRIAAAVACAAAIPAVLIASRIRRDKEEKRSALVKFSVCGTTVSLLCLVDSGNLLKEPISGDPVLVVASSAAPRLPDDVVSYLLCGSGEPPAEIMPRVRIIPAKAVTGTGLLRAIRPDALLVNGEEKRAYISLSDAGKGAFGTYDGVIPPSIT